MSIYWACASILTYCVGRVTLASPKCPHPDPWGLRSIYLLHYMANGSSGHRGNSGCWRANLKIGRLSYDLGVGGVQCKNKGSSMWKETSTRPEGCDVRKTQPAITGSGDGGRATSQGTGDPQSQKRQGNGFYLRASRKEGSSGHTLTVAQGDHVRLLTHRNVK